jgi:SAM-dependent methyltransferase
MSRDHLARLLAPLGPVRPADELVREINRIYHAAEATTYDTTHPEIFDELPAMWQRMVEHASLPVGPLTVVDYGCGTGFAASQIVRLLGPARIGKLVCFDPSPEMLARCETRLRATGIPVQLCTTAEDFASETVDLLLTSSVLHHLPDPLEVARTLRPQLRSTSVWLAGHEPSARFYRNSACVAVWRRFERERRLRTLLSPRRLWAIGRQRLGLASDVATVTAREVAARGWFREAPGARTIDRIVDLHVAHDPREAEAGRGLDVGELARQLSDRWSLQWTISYSFLGATRERSAPARWQRAAAALARAYPGDGAHFSAIWVPR